MYLPKLPLCFELFEAQRASILFVYRYPPVSFFEVTEMFRRRRSNSTEFRDQRKFNFHPLHRDSLLVIIDDKGDKATLSTVFVSYLLYPRVGEVRRNGIVKNNMGLSPRRFVSPGVVPKRIVCSETARMRVQKMLCGVTGAVDSPGKYLG